VKTLLCASSSIAEVKNALLSDIGAYLTHLRITGSYISNGPLVNQEWLTREILRTVNNLSEGLHDYVPSVWFYEIIDDPKDRLFKLFRTIEIRDDKEAQKIYP